ncbi:MAG: xanthine dehydrogenase family protein subunit M [Immundisolibacter sp.]|uniref:FAD binding domain-containing protein n=1 Tax=Immundisolibacter sp. TaxID=1934948 RepID=UPI00198E0B72|nr:xanthine dehydrogenase family protein subunit M [Immundisolibacter sp.]MBC7160820.1 xanthine dehydrogenase family protein subunit M [Immundisolibacter sp.]
MHSFDYAAPTSLGEALTLLAGARGNARVLAGGTDLIVNMRVGRRKPGLVVDGKRIPELNELSLTADGLTLGAAVSCRRAYEHAEVAKRYPALVDSMSLIGSVHIQGRATVGGNLCNAAPSGDSIPTLIALGAVARVLGPNGTREVPVEDFCVAPGKTCLADDELLVSVFIPAPTANSGAHYLRFIPRNEMDIAIAGAGVSVVLDAAKQNFVSARIALASVGPTPIFAREAGALLAGKPISEDSIQLAADSAQAVARPITDMRGTIEQRKHLVKVLTARALRGAIERAKGA